MKIKVHDPHKSQSIREVYGLYWAMDLSSNPPVLRRYHLIIPYDGYAGFIVCADNECDVVDPILRSNFILFRGKHDYGDTLLHHLLVEGDLMYRLTDPPDEEALHEFMLRLEKDT